MRQRKSIWQDIRGATSFMFIAASAAFLGVAGLGLDLGTWYVERRHGQGVADAAAVAGVLGLPAADAAARAVASDNGYTNGGTTTVSITNPPTSGPQAGNAAAVKVVLSRSMPRTFIGVLMGSGSQTVAETATAVRVSTGNACSLSLGGGLSFSGSAAVTANNCVLASNRTGPDSISFTGAGSSKTQANAILVGEGGCTQSGSGSPCTQPGNLMYQPPALDPYAALQSDPIPSAVNASNCTSSKTATSPFLVSGGAYKVYCVGANLRLNGAGAGTVDLDNPGGVAGAGINATYYFYNSSIAVSNGTLRCTHCTIIFTGSSASQLGTLSITGGTVNLTSIVSNSNNAHLNGVLFYMDARYAEHTSACGSSPVSIQGSSTITLNGALYFPNASVCMTGNAFASSETCMALTGWSIAYTGNLTEVISGCGDTGTSVAQVEAVTLVQ